MSQMHFLKTDPAMWYALRDGKKTAEFRFDDRGFEIGDELMLVRGKALDIDAPVLKRAITHIVRGPAFGIPEGYAMLSLAEPQDEGEARP